MCIAYRQTQRHVNAAHTHRHTQAHLHKHTHTYSQLSVSIASTSIADRGDFHSHSSAAKRGVCAVARPHFGTKCHINVHVYRRMDGWLAACACAASRLPLKLRFAVCPDCDGDWGECATRQRQRERKKEPFQLAFSTSFAYSISWHDVASHTLAHTRTPHSHSHSPLVSRASHSIVQTFLSQTTLR